MVHVAISEHLKHAVGLLSLCTQLLIICKQLTMAHSAWLATPHPFRVETANKSQTHTSYPVASYPTHQNLPYLSYDTSISLHSHWSSWEVLRKEALSTNTELPLSAARSTRWSPVVNIIIWSRGKYIPSLMSWQPPEPSRYAVGGFRSQYLPQSSVLTCWQTDAENECKRCNAKWVQLFWWVSVELTSCTNAYMIIVGVARTT